MTIFTKNHEFFRIFFKLAIVMEFDTQVKRIWILEKINQLTRFDFKNINSITTNTCSPERNIWNIFSWTLYL